MNQYLTFAGLQDQKIGKKPHAICFKSLFLWAVLSTKWFLTFACVADDNEWSNCLAILVRSSSKSWSHCAFWFAKQRCQLSIWHWTSSAYVNVQPAACWSLGRPFHSSTATANVSPFFLFIHRIKASSILSCKK